MIYFLSFFLFVFPSIAEAAKRNSSSFANRGLILLICFSLVILLCIYLWIMSIVSENKELKEKLYSKTNPFQMEIRRIEERCEDEIKSINKKANERIEQKEKDFNFRLSLCNMRSTLQKNPTKAKMIQDLLKIDNYFVQIKNRQEFLKNEEMRLQKYERELNDKDIIKLKMEALQQKEADIIAHEERTKKALQQKEADIIAHEERTKKALQQKETDIIAETQMLQSVIDNNSKNSYPPLAKAIGEYLTRKQTAYEEYLRTKQHPAPKKADILSETKKQLREYICKYQQIKYLFHWV